VFVLFCVILLLLTAVQIFIVVPNPPSGMDYRVFKGAVQSLNNGEDPYSLSNVIYFVGGSLPFNYPPHTLLFFWCLQFLFVYQSIWIYYALLVAFLAASGYIIAITDQKPQLLFLITLLLTGFMGIFWNFQTGNKDIIFLYLFAWIFYLMLRENFWKSSIIMGLMGSFSLITLPFIAVYLVVKRSVADRIKYILLSIGVAAVIFLITWLLTPSLFSSYIENIRGSSSPLYDESGINTPTPFLMFTALLNPTKAGIIIPSLVVSFLYVSFIIGSSWYIFKKNQDKPLIVYSFVVLAIFMILPRVKPYDFIILIPSLYFLFRDYENKIKVLVLVVVSLLPLAVWYYFLIDRTQPISYLKYLIYSYSQTFSLLLIFIIAFVLAFYKPLPSKDSNS
jgi:hypothetical protein